MTANESRWPASPLYLAGLDALREVVPDADPTPLALEFERTGREMTAWPHWPHPDRAVRDRFHARWTANVQARCGLDPLTVSTVATNDSALETVTTGKSGRPRKVVVAERTAAMVEEYAAGASTADLAAKYALSVSRVQYALRGAGVDLKERQRISTTARERVVAVFLADPEVSVAEVARMFGVSRQAVSEHLRKAGVEPYRSSIHSRNARIRWARVRQQEAA